MAIAESINGFLPSPDTGLAMACSFPETLWESTSRDSELHRGAARGGLCNCLPR